MQNEFFKSRCFQKRRTGFFLLVIMFFFILITGCVTGSSKPQYTIDHYLVSYPAPSWNVSEKLTASIKFNRFTIASAYNSTNMFFRSDAYSIDSFNYSRWVANPADMIADSLLADMRSSGLFSAVFSRHETDEGRFTLSGGIEEFYLKVDKKGKTALISIFISLQDTQEKEAGKRMLFQKKYSREEPLPDASPRGYCQSTSMAMQAISREILGDLYAAVKARIK